MGPAETIAAAGSPRSSDCPYRSLVRRVVAITAALAVLFSAGTVWWLHAALHKRFHTAFSEYAAQLARQIEFTHLRNELTGVVRGIGLTNRRCRQAVQPGGTQDEASLVAELTRIKEHYGASIVYIMNAAGLVVACSPYDDGKTLTGNNYAFRPYFQRALAGQDTVYPALGVTTFRRGLYYSAPIYWETPEPDSPQQARGVIVIKMGLGMVDEFLGRLSQPAALITPQGIVFASNQQDWLFRTVVGGDSAAIDERQFGTQAQKKALPIPAGTAWTRYEGQLHALATAPLDLGSGKKTWKMLLLGNGRDVMPAWLTAATLAAILVVHLLGGLLAVSHLEHQRTAAAKSREREEAQALLAERERYYRAIFETTGTATIIIEGDTTISLANREVTVLTGYGREEIEGRLSWTNIVAPEDLQRLRNYHSNRRSGGAAPGNCEFTLLTRGGDRRMVHAVVAMIPGSTRSVCSMLDITDRKQTEEALILAERLAAVGTLAGGVAHEFNNINTTILGFAQLSLDETDISDRTRKALERIEQSARRAKNVTTNLLRFAGQQDVIQDVASLDAVVSETLQLVAEEFRTEGITIQVEGGETTPTVMDPAQIGQIVLNLLINARHALLDRPRREIRMSTGEDAEWVWLEVTDTGCGIPPEQQSKVFLPFFSTKGEHASTVTPQARVKGTGLGLSVSHTIANNHGGGLQVNSTAEVGTTFTLRLPLRRAREALEVAAPMPQTGPVTDCRRVLVLDDEADIRALLQVRLSREGIEVAATENGEEALTWLQEKPFALLLVDLQLPNMNGVEFLHRQAELDLTIQPRIFVITGRLSDDSDPTAYGRNVERIITKPFDLDDLVKQVSQVV